MSLIFRPAILYVDDEPANLKVFQTAFQSDFLVKTCASGPEALELLKRESFPIVISDQRMPGMTGIELCEKLIEVSPHSIRMILTAYTETQILLDAINRGQVHDYIVKPWKKSEIKPLLDRAFDHYKQKSIRLKELEERAEKADLLERESIDHKMDGIVGQSKKLKEILALVEKAAPTDATILILGETGTGKELIARRAHEMSKRKSKHFVPVNCSALSKTVMESELFGHEKGAFTGADQVRKGRFEYANGGTVFLDEIGELSEEVQVKLLRVLQEKQIERVGANQAMDIDVRIIAATHQNLLQMSKDGRFREDLYYRLNVIPITVPPLRDRLEDVPLLANYFVSSMARIQGKDLRLSAQAIDHLCRYDWPGNIRELKNIIERAVILAMDSEIGPDDLKLEISEGLTHDIVNLQKTSLHSGNIRNEIQKIEIQKCIDAMTHAKGNISEAARTLGVARSTLFDRLKKFGLI